MIKDIFKNPEFFCKRVLATYDDNSYIEKFGYTVSAKVKVEKKHWWNRSWKTFITHAPTTAEAIRKGLGFLESYGYTIEFDTDQFEERASNPDHS